MELQKRQQTPYPSLVRRIIFSKELGLLLLLIGVIVFVAIQAPAARQTRVYFDLLREISPRLIAAIGITMLMLAGEFDLSIGSMLAVTGVVTVVVFNATGSILLGVIAGMATGPIVGAIHAYLVTVQGMNSLVTTLGTMFALRGMVYVYTNQTPIVVANREDPAFQVFEELYHGEIGPIPTPAVIAIVLLIIFHLVLTQTSFGRQVYAIGGNETAAAVSGIRVRRVKFMLFMLCSTTAAFAGLLLVAQSSTAYFNAGAQGFELIVIASVVLGGVSLAGGEGGLIGALLGVLILGMTGKGLRLMRIDTNWQLVITGIVMGVAVYIHNLRNRVTRSKS